VLVDRTRSWVGSFAFHHALDLAYGRHVAGCVVDAPEEIFYTCSPGPEGVRHQPWPILARAWQARPRTYGYHELIVFRSEAPGRATLLEEWPAGLPALPAGARYAPRSRVVNGSAPASRSILRRLSRPPAA
jgi:hypothetical protein